MTTPDPIRAALERLITMASDELTTPGLWAHSRATWNDAMTAARAALAAAPEGEPSDEDLYDLAELFNGDPVPAMRRALELWGRPAAPPAAPDDRGVLPLIVSETGADDEPEIERITCRWISGGADYVNNMPKGLGLERTTPEGSIIADYVQSDISPIRPLAPPTPPEGEVGELVAWLGVVGEQFRLADLSNEADQTDRAATLLEQLVAPAPAVVPVAVSERLPGPQDCDAEGRCWLLTVEDDYPQWRLHSVEGHQPGGRMIWVPVDRTPGVMVDAFYVSHWLPAHALPLPAPQGGEVEG